MKKKIITAGFLLIISALCAEGVTVNTGMKFAPKAIQDVPFINGNLKVPVAERGPNNRGVIKDKTLPGMTHIECYLNWRLSEPERDKWNSADFDEMLALSREYGLKMVVLPCIVSPPDWLRATTLYVPLRDWKSGEAVNYLSPWADGTYEAIDHFFAWLGRYSEKIDIITYYIEVGLSLSAAVPVGYIPDAGALKDHGGFWCGDEFARADFRERMLSKYGTLESLNKAWGTHYAAQVEIAYPDTENRMNEVRRWVDFLEWYQESQTRAMVRFVNVVRKYFPKTIIDMLLGFGNDDQRFGCDRTGVVAAAADCSPTVIRSTHAGFNRNKYPQAYWFYKRMAPSCHNFGIAFGTEPPGGNLTYLEMQRAIFEAAGAGANYIFQYYQNFHQTPNKDMKPQIIADYKKTLRPEERPVVDIGIVFPTCQQMLDLTGYPDGQLEFCAKGRAFIDYDIIDENMIGWGRLNDYRILIHTSGAVFREATLTGIDSWLRTGGIMITREYPVWNDLGGGNIVSTQWRTGRNGERTLAVGKGMIVCTGGTDIPSFLQGVLAELSTRSAKHSLRGYKTDDDGTWMTEFPSGKLFCNTNTFALRFVPH